MDGSGAGSEFQRVSTDLKIKRAGSPACRELLTSDRVSV